jgi:hypothetical protein
MRSSRFWASLGVLLLGVTPVLAQPQPDPGLDLYVAKKKLLVKKLDRYLTRDGFLTATLEVSDAQKGFGTFFANVWRIEPDGSWSAIEINRNQPRPRGAGQLSKKELRILAEVLADADPLSLTNQGRPLVNPHVTTIIYGGNRAERTYGVDLRLPVVDPLAPLPADPLVPGVNLTARYSAVLTGVRGLLEPKLLQEELPRRLQ